MKVCIGYFFFAIVIIQTGETWGYIGRKIAHLKRSGHPVSVKVENGVLHIVSGRPNGVTHADANHDHAHAHSKDGGHAHAAIHDKGSYAKATTTDKKHGSISVLKKRPGIDIKFTHHYRKKRAVIKKLLYGKAA